MEEHPTKHRRFGRDRNRPKANLVPEKESLDNFLIKTGIQPFVFVGQCARYFGFLTVAAFLLGAATVYGYAVFRPLPYAKATTEPPVQVKPEPSKTVQLRGLVRDYAGKPMKEPFTVGVLAKQFGPVQNSEGSFALEVPQSNSYDVALWNSETVKVFNGFAAEQDGNGYRLQQALPFLQAVSDAEISRSRDSRSRGPLAQSELAASKDPGTKTEKLIQH